MKQAVRGPTAKLDDTERRECRGIPFNAGCTACVCFMTEDTIYCSNSGDSRAILVDKTGKVTELSHDHKPDEAGEMKRIKAAGGFVDDGRVQGVIAVSRAIGDWEYKNPSLLPQLEKRVKKSKKQKEAVQPAGPYRNIGESKKH